MPIWRTVRGEDNLNMFLPNFVNLLI